MLSLSQQKGSLLIRKEPEKQCKLKNEQYLNCNELDKNEYEMGN